MTVGAGQRIVASIGADLGALDPASHVAVALCYQATVSGSLTSFNGNVQWLDVSPRATQVVSATASPGAGTYVVGYCVQNASPDHTLDFDGNMSGWVMVTGP